MTVRTYRGISAEERRAERRARVKDACLDVVGEGGVAKVTVEAVSAGAGLTKRYFYESFPDLDTLLAEVIDDIFTGLLTDILATLPGIDSIPERADTIARMLIDFFQRDARRARLYVEAPGHPTLRARREVAFQTYTRLLLEHLQPEDTPLDRRREVAALIIVAGVTQAASEWLRDGRVGGSGALTRDQIVDEIARVMIAALE